ncbi:MAG: hypothetical protein EHM14_14435 [Methanothrix sp.]|nr:MAG: hypothetical protein EHM14_14435 [Methanothrix sp.]
MAKFEQILGLFIGAALVIFGFRIAIAAFFGIFSAIEGSGLFGLVLVIIGLLFGIGLFWFGINILKDQWSKI